MLNNSFIPFCLSLTPFFETAGKRLANKRIGDKRKSSIEKTLIFWSGDNFHRSSCKSARSDHFICVNLAQLRFNSSGLCSLRTARYSVSCVGALIVGDRGSQWAKSGWAETKLYKIHTNEVIIACWFARRSVKIITTPKYLEERRGNENGKTLLLRFTFLVFFFVLNLINKWGQRVS